MKYFAFLLSLFAASLLQAIETYELRIYNMVSDEAAAQFDNWMQNGGMDAFKQSGAAKVGIFKPKAGDEAPEYTRMVLAVYKSLADVAENVRAPFIAKGANPQAEAFLDGTKQEPSYARVDSSLLTAFPAFKNLKDPKGKGTKDRFFELRVYESASERHAALKVDMFCDGGEIDIFNDVGLNSVFFGSARIASNFPQLTYMLVHESEEAHQQAWDNFRNAEAWQTLRKQEKYVGTVSNITKYFLVAMPYSQIK